MKWRGSDGTDKKVRIYNRAQSKWKSIALRLGLDFDAIEHDHKNDHSRVLHVFREWTDNASGLCNKAMCPFKWSGLLSLLKDSDLGELASQAHEALIMLFTHS